MNGALFELSAEIVGLLRAKRLSFASAESCTGGAVASAITSVSGCSDVMLGAVVAYDNSVKRRLLGVAEETIAKYGAVSEEVVREMVHGISRCMGVTCAVATSGIAGPGGGTVEKPVGTVWVAVMVQGVVVTKLLMLGDAGRMDNIKRTVLEALQMLKHELGGR